MTAHYRLDDGVAVITLDNPPVNGLGHATRRAVADGVAHAADDPRVRAIVLTGAGRGFSGGADIREFNSPKALEEPTLRTLINAVEGSAKPVIAALHGVAMGGGLELALGCHYRVSAPGTQVALPEVKLGLLPGAGGTQRLPRLIGLEAALRMIVSGDPVRADVLADSGLFDRIVDGALLEGALAFAREVALAPNPHPRARDRAVTHPDPEGVLAAARSRLATGGHPLPAPLHCIEALQAAVSQNFDEGLRRERAAFVALIESPESKALRHAFFSERAAARIPDVPPDTPVRTIRSVGVVGAGTMGVGIAMNFLNAGIPVALLESSGEALARGVATMRRNYEASAAKGKLSAADVEHRMGLLEPTHAIADLADVDLAIEAVFEDMEVKQALLEQLDRTMKPGAILASNTSTLDLDRLAACTRRPTDVVGLHFFSPANVMKLLEVVRGGKTAPDVLATVMKLAARIGKTPVVSRVCDGFIGNRMLGAYLRQAFLLLQEGASPAQVDRAIEQFGFAMGPFRMSDLAGNDIGWAVRKRRYAEQGEHGDARVADHLCEMGRFGQKTGAGWYDYPPGERVARPSPVVDAMIAGIAADASVPRRAITDAEIVERLVHALINEGATVLEDGIAARASDIDTVYVTGYGFPRHRGGPMYFADRVGLPEIVRAIERHAAGPHGGAWRVAPLLAQRARDGQSFNT